MSFPLDLQVFADPEAVARHAAQCVAECLEKRSRPVLGLATGRTPLAVYAELRRRAGSGTLSFSGVRTFNLDEYRGLPPEHPASYHAYMRRELFDHVDIRKEDWHLPDGLADPIEAGARYEEQIRASGGIDLQLLGIGENGHIGFNEPGATFDSRTREVRLAPSTIRTNATEFPEGEMPPSHALTMGIATILEARRIVLLATGRKKAQALAAAVNGPPSPAVPASALRLHPAVTILCDTQAAQSISGSGTGKLITL